MQVEPVRIHPDGEPGAVLVLEVAQVFDRPELGGELVPAVDAADVVRRAGAPPGLAAGDRVVGRAGAHIGDAQHVLPAVAEVVLVVEPVTRLAQHLVEAHLAFGRAGGALVFVELGQEVVALARTVEVVQVTVVPPHRRLEPLVQLVETLVTAQLEPAPDLGVRVLELDQDGERDRVVRRLGQLDRLVHVHPEPRTVGRRLGQAVAAEVFGEGRQVAAGHDGADRGVEVGLVTGGVHPTSKSGRAPICLRPPRKRCT